MFVKKERKKRVQEKQTLSYTSIKCFFISVFHQSYNIHIENSNFFPCLAASQHGKCFSLPLERCYRYTLERPVIVS